MRYSRAFRYFGIATVVCSIFLSIAAGDATPSYPVSVQQRTAAGTWILWRRSLGVDMPLRVRIDARADSLALTGSNGLKLTGLASGDRIAFRGKTADGSANASIDVRWQGDSLVGTGTAGEISGAAWIVRERTRPASAPTRQVFHPTEFPRVFTSTIAPALRIWPGDTVRTETISAGGIDSAGKRRANGGNPLTGPFWIEGAMPGDVIAVRLHRIRTNSVNANSGAGISWNAVTPGYIDGFKDAEDSSTTWVMDATARTARLKTPSEALRSFTVPLRPMLGCVGVAPGAVGRAETRSSGFPGRFGGNMDYNQIVEGTTVYLQVAQPGAFLFIGDAHGAQGAGEIVGSGLETPMDVEFSVELIRDKSIGFPRIESGTHLMSVGVAGSLDRAFQIATTGLAEWLEQEYKLTRSEAAIVMGVAAEYDIAEVVDGDLNIVAKMPKSALRGVTVRR